MFAKGLHENNSSGNNEQNTFGRAQDTFRFPKYSLEDGLVESITRYDGPDKVVILKCKERFFGRKDGLIEIISSPRRDIMRFDATIAGGLIGVVQSVTGWDIYWKFRPDGLFKATYSNGRYFNTFFVGREDKVIERRGLADVDPGRRSNFKVSDISVHFGEPPLDAQSNMTGQEGYHESEHTNHLAMCFESMSRANMVQRGRLNNGSPSWELTVHDRARAGGPGCVDAQQCSRQATRPAETNSNA
jgi:hypothetical protein